MNIQLVDPIKITNEKRLIKISECIDKLCQGFKSVVRPSENFQRKGSLFHYTSFSKLFALLEGDAFWASRSRFSNDSTEDKLFNDEWIKKNQYYGDNYIICFCENGDLLSQWRGYCPQGGASIELLMGNIHPYTLLNSNYEETNAIDGTKVITYSNSPLRVIYSRPSLIRQCFGADIDSVYDGLQEVIKEANSNCGTDEITESDIVPFLKNGFFFEERERRLVFDNSDGEIEKCVRFRKIEDDSRIPYIVVKYGNLVYSGQKLADTYTESYIGELFEKQKNNRSEAIIIPCGIDQEEICKKFSRKLKEHKLDVYSTNGNIKREEDRPIKIICDGHLPIIGITVSPSPQQEQMRERIERFCRSKYWLQNVEVKCSPIPYIAPKL